MAVTVEILFLSISALLVLSVVASKFSDRFGIPALVIFLIVGMLAGSEGLGGIYFDNPSIAQGVGLFALAVILFSGGLDTDWGEVRGVVKEGLALATAGTLLTALILGLAAHWILGFSLLEGVLIGAITSSTDAAAVFSLLRSQGLRLSGRLAPLLEFESGSNDPMAVFLTIGLIQLLLSPGESILSLVLLFFQQMVIGAILGLVFGRLLLFLINRLRLGYQGLYPVLVLGMVLLSFSVTSLLHGSGFLAVYLVGILLGRADFLHKNSLSRFYEGLAWLLQIVMFLTLGLLVFPSRLLSVALPGIALAAVLILVARPVSVWISLLPFHFSPREKNFLSWVGLRGAVPIILATYPRLSGLDSSGLIFNVIFFIVLASILVQGTTLGFAARWFQVQDPAESKPDYPIDNLPGRGWPEVLKEVVINENSPLAGRAIYEIGLPRDYLVVLIARDGQFVIPNGSIVLQANDRMLGLARPETHQLVEDLIQRAAAEGELPAS